jgi:hypothetical protein
MAEEIKSLHSGVDGILELNHGHRHRYLLGQNAMGYDIENPCDRPSNQGSTTVILLARVAVSGKRQ